MGVQPLLGDLADSAALRRGSAGADAVVMAAFPRDAYARLDAAVALDRAVVATLAAGAGARLLYTSGISVVGVPAGGVIDDDTPPDPPPVMRWRRDLELAVLAAGGVVLRPVLVHGRGSGDILVALLRSAVERGEAAYPAPGDAPWPTVHVDDLGRAFALALERAPAASTFNVAAGQTTPREVVEAIARLAGVPARGVSAEEADEDVPYARWLGGPCRVEAGQARELLGWEPREPDLSTDIEHGSYRPRPS
jgi:nucleoside-diphosphate-sugar epimerase